MQRIAEASAQAPEQEVLTLKWGKEVVLRGTKVLPLVRTAWTTESINDEGSIEDVLLLGAEDRDAGRALTEHLKQQLIGKPYREWGRITSAMKEMDAGQ